MSATVELAKARVQVRAAVQSLIRATDKSQPNDPMVRVLGDLANIALRINGDPSDPPSEDEIMRAVDVLARTDRYSVKDNDNEEWIA